MIGLVIVICLGLFFIRALWLLFRLVAAAAMLGVSVVQLIVEVVSQWWEDKKARS